MSSTTTRNAITERERQRIREYARSHPHLKQADIVAWASATFGREINQSIVSRSLHERFSYLDTKTLMPRESGSKRGSSADHPVLEKAIFEWFTRMQDQAITISGDMIQEAARHLWRSMPDFSLLPEPTFSQGWLSRFKKRHKIRQFKQSGEAADVNTTTSAGEVERLRCLIGRYEAKDIFNTDETALFWLMAPEYTLGTAARSGRKKKKNRVTVLPTCNADGTEKLDLWVIGHYANPRPFGTRGRNVENLPFVWRYNAKGWMTTPIFIEYLQWFDRKMVGRKVLLLFDNFAAHSSAVKQIVKTAEQTGSPVLLNTTVEFLPANTTSVYQPLDQGIIKNLKVHYRKLWLQQIVSLAVAGNDDPYANITILNAVQWIIEAWNKVKSQTISNCWRHSQILGVTYGPDKAPPGWSEEVHLRQLTEAAHRQGLIRQAMDINSLISHDDEVVRDSPEDILMHVAETYSTVVEVDEELAAEQHVVAPPKPAVLLDALNLVLQNIPPQHQHNLDVVAWLRLYRFEVTQSAIVEESKKKQATLDSFWRRVEQG